jgi:tRNA-uridine 2-sulfurtransferase
VIVGAAAELGSDALRTGLVNWISGAAPADPLRCTVQIRYRARPAPAVVTPLPDGRADVIFDAPLRDITPGQAAVFYAEDQCLGGGVITVSDRALEGGNGGVD